jgi:riboflavin kinase/FMN adenylyltransferase
MQVFHSIAAAASLRNCALAIGNFDGVHVGHRRLFELARERASARGAKAVALTFEPHPVRVLRPELSPPLLTPLPRKLELFATCGLDAAVVQPFDRAYAGTDADEFVARDLARHLGAADVVVGHDFTAGRSRARVDRLRPLLQARGIELTVVDPVACDGLVASSTKIRELLLEGHIDGAAQLLGRLHDVEGAIERGGQRGRGFGFATANLRPEALLPANGVYVVTALLGGCRGPLGLEGAVRYGGVCNVGVKPTIQEDGVILLEAHLFEVDGRDLYGEHMRVSFVQRLREERRFPSVDALRAQIARDAARAREVLQSR